MEWGEELNFENLVLFYKEELNEIRGGANASDVLSKYDVKKLRKKRILYLTAGGEGGRRIALTEKAEEILKAYDAPQHANYENLNKPINDISRPESLL